MRRVSPRELQVRLKERSLRLGVLFVLLLVLGGMALMYQGHDAVSQAITKKDGILTADQVKLAFENIGGRLVDKRVHESQEVRRGEILMVLDSTDVDLGIASLRTQVDQLNAQIDQLGGSIAIGYRKASTSEQQALRLIEQQKLALDAAKATYDNQKLDYNRKKALCASGAVSRAEFDSASMALSIAAANVGQQQRLLDKQLAGTSAAARSRVFKSGDARNVVLPEIEQQRQGLANSRMSVEVLKAQLADLLVQLKELEVKRSRLVLRAPEDGKILKIIAQPGEMVEPNVPVALLESKRYYYDLYLDERQAVHFRAGDRVCGRTIAGNREVGGVIRLVAAAPGFADLKMSREKSQADLTAFQVRIYTDPSDYLLPGMTIRVNTDEYLKG